MPSRWERPSGSASWARDDRGWVPYTPELKSVRYENSIQTITVVASAGQFSVEYGTETATAVAFNCLPADLEAALTGLSSIDSGQVTVTESGGVYTIDLGPAFQPVEGLLTVDTAALTGTAVVAVVDPAETLTLSSNDTHQAEGFWRAEGRRIEARGAIGFGEGADLDSLGWWAVTLPTPAAGYTQHTGSVYLQDVSSGMLRLADAMAFPQVDGDDPASFLVVLDGETTATGDNPMSATVPWDWDAGDQILWWVTYEPAELET